MLLPDEQGLITQQLKHHLASSRTPSCIHSDLCDGECVADELALDDDGVGDDLADAGLIELATVAADWLSAAGAWPGAQPPSRGPAPAGGARPAPRISLCQARRRPTSPSQTLGVAA
jgi:hypothetical protein